MNTYDIRNKEVINIYDGRSLGFVEDVELNLEKGTIEAIIIPAERGFMGLFPRGEDLVIRWRDIKRIGDDVILVTTHSRPDYGPGCSCWQQGGE